MKISDYITWLRKEHNIVLTISGSDQLVLQGDQNTLTEELIADIKDRKEDILTFFKRSKVEVITKAPQKRYYRASSAQKRLHYLQELNPDSMAYNIPRSFLLKGQLDVNRLSEIFNELVKRHEILQTSVQVVQNEVFQTFFHWAMVLKT